MQYVPGAQAAKRRAVIRECQDAVNPLKSRLIDELKKLEAAGCIGKAKSLGTIIGRLEAWQNT